MASATSELMKSAGAVVIEMDEVTETSDGSEVYELAEAESLPFERVAERPPRVNEPIEVEAVTKAGRRRFLVRDISLTGLYIPGVTAPIGREVPLHIPLPGEEPIDISARVVRCDRAPKRGLGLTFSRIGWEDLLSLARYLAPRL